MIRLHRRGKIDAESLLAVCGLPHERARAIAEMLRDNVAYKHALARRAQRNGSGGFDLLAWGGKYLPGHFSRPPSRMHRWLAEQLDRMQHERGVKLNVLGPRGGANRPSARWPSPFRAAMEGREPYIWIVSDTRHQACATWKTSRRTAATTRCWPPTYPRPRGEGRCGGTVRSCCATARPSRPSAPGQRIRGRRRRELGRR